MFGFFIVSPQQTTYVCFVVISYCSHVCNFRKRALVHHPDRHAGASDNERREQERKFKEVGEAYGVLSDPKKRARYDQGQDLDEDGSGMAG